jgi:hypothetical protein
VQIQNTINNRIDVILVCVLTSSAVDREFESKDDKINIGCFSSNHASTESKYRLAQNKDNVFE